MVPPIFHNSKPYDFQFTAFFSALPALNAGTFIALICIGSPVFGLRPILAARFLTLKEPKPTNTTESLRLSELVIASIVAFKTRPAAAFESSVDSAIASISSDLFTMGSPLTCLISSEKSYGQPFLTPQDKALPADYSKAQSIN